MSIIVGILSIISLLMIYSTTRYKNEKDGLSATGSVIKQIIFIGLGIGVAYVIANVDYQKIKEKSLYIYLGSIGFLMLVFVPGLGVVNNGTRGWIRTIGSFQIQPAEFVKLTLIVALSTLSGMFIHIGYRQIASIFAITFVPIALIILQPDLGTTIVLLVVSFSIISIAGTDWKMIVSLLIIGVIGIFASIQVGLLKDYQVDRLTAFASPNELDTTVAQHLLSSKTAIGNGGIFGKGYLNGDQTKLAFVAYQQTDFIFTAVAEEFGFVGAGILIVLEGLLVWRIWNLAKMCSDTSAVICLMAIACMFAFQIFENIGMTMGMLPITGITLPFISLGGSSSIVAFAAIGLVNSVKYNQLGYK